MEKYANMPCQISIVSRLKHLSFYTFQTKVTFIASCVQQQETKSEKNLAVGVSTGMDVAIQ